LLLLARERGFCGVVAAVAHLCWPCYAQGGQRVWKRENTILCFGVGENEQETLEVFAPRS
jgi:hypothetical protein